MQLGINLCILTALRVRKIYCKDSFLGKQSSSHNKKSMYILRKTQLSESMHHCNGEQMMNVQCIGIAVEFKCFKVSVTDMRV